ncbi:probable disease resistance protein At1g58602 [Corylus avellana]|uniref:probable disease resistance protein At1g58602 n=1 Tax=Corylus avellana TaxID=13451 RepID=UPI00286A16B7|nr:probable disease resistance protein At1g58602 [Corylus avellana]
MDFLDVVEVVSAVILQLKARSYGESYIIDRAIIQVAETIRKDLERNKYFLINGEVEKLLENLLAAVYKMEDFAETVVPRRMHERRMGFGRRYIFILRQILNLKARVDFASEMKKIVSEINHAIDELGVSRQSHPREESDVIGSEEEKGKMVTWLTDTNSCPNLGFILISGQSGSGQTTLATKIYKSREIERHFEFRAWVSASDDHVSNLRSILQKITEDSMVVDMESTERESMEKKICEILHKKRWLIVVDNVQNPNLFKTRPGSALSDVGDGSRSRVIMTMTTTSENECLIKGFMDGYQSLCYELQPLQDEDAWHLFLKKVRLLPDNVESSDIDKLKRKVLAKCEGIPSAILVLGRFLSTKKCYEEWLAVLEHWDSKIFALMNSEQLSGSRPCLLYFGLFPKGYEIPVRRLLRLWLAEGLIVTDNRNPEEIAQGILTNFKNKGLIEIVKRRKDRSAKTCRMTGILYDFCLSKAEDIFGLLHIHPTAPDDESSDASPKFGVRSVADHCDIKNYSRKYSHMQHLRSYLSFNIQKKDTPVVGIGNFLSEVIGHRGFGLLKVLDLERVYKPTLPQNLGQLYLLRYLGLRWTFLDTIPHSVSELRYLETLDVKHTYISSLPNSIWKMEDLRHLCLNEIRLDMENRNNISLTKLQTLWGLFVDNNSPVENGLDRSINLRKLGLTFHLDHDSVDKLNAWIAHLEGLESLRLRSKDEDGRPSKLELKPLSSLKNLTNLYLLGNLPELHSEYFPQSIKVLTLSVSKLEKDPMPILARLPKLSVLQLLADSYNGKEMVYPNGGFQSLKSLKLWMLKELETWTMEQGAMQNLEELEIRCCHKLKEIPIINRNSIGKIILTNMQEEFVVNVRAKFPKEILETPPPLPVRCDHCRDVKQTQQNSSTTGDA